MDEEPLARSHARHVHDPVPRGQVNGGEAGAFLEAPALGEREEAPLLGHDLARVTAEARHGEDATTVERLSRDLEAGRERRGRTGPVEPLARIDVREVEPARLHLDENLSRARDGRGLGPDLED